MNEPISVQPVNEGDILDGKYRVDRVLGVGGMGVVVAATHLQLDQRVAIKFLLPEALEHPEIVERFGREARAAAKVHGQHVVRVIDVGRLPDGRHYMVMEYLDGEDLEHVLRKHVKVPVIDAVGFVLQACEAVAQAHSAGIIHRDLKPANLFLANTPDRRTVVKVLDFGISKVAGDKAITKTATAMGTAYYMSPEQLMSSKDVDERSDIWALGVILFELIGGEKPYEGEALPEIVAKILSNSRPKLRDLSPDVPEILESAITKSLQTHRNDRFASVTDFARAIGPFASDEHRGSVARIGRMQERDSLPPPAPISFSGGLAGDIPKLSGPPTALMGNAPTPSASQAPEIRLNAELNRLDARPSDPPASPLAGTQLAVAGTSGDVVPSKGRKSTALIGFAAAGLLGVLAIGYRLSHTAPTTPTIAAQTMTSTTTAAVPTAAVPTAASTPSATTERLLATSNPNPPATASALGSRNLLAPAPSTTASAATQSLGLTNIPSTAKTTTPAATAKPADTASSFQQIDTLK